MRKLLAIIALFCSVLASHAQYGGDKSNTIGSSATVTHVGTPACNPVSSNTNAVTYTPHATGDQIFLSIAALSTSSSLISSISDGESSSYAAAVSPAIGSAYSAYLWDTLSVNSGVTTITVHFASSVNNVVCVSEYSGGVELGNTGTPATWTSSPGSGYSASVTMHSESGNIAIASVSIGESSTVTYTPTNGTIRASGFYSADPGGAIADESCSSGATCTINGSYSPAGHSGAETIVELRAH